MLPYKRDYMESRLIQKGYSYRAVENMKPWRLISCYTTVQKQYEKPAVKEVSFYEKRAVWDSKKGTYVSR